MSYGRGPESGSESEDSYSYYYGQHDGYDGERPMSTERPRPRRSRQYTYPGYDEHYHGDYWRQMYSTPQGYASQYGGYGGQYYPSAPPPPPPPVVSDTTGLQSQPPIPVPSVTQRGNAAEAPAAQSSMPPGWRDSMIHAVNEYLHSLTTEQPVVAEVENVAEVPATTEEVPQLPAELPPLPPGPPPPPPPPVNQEVVDAPEVVAVQANLVDSAPENPKEETVNNVKRAAVDVNDNVKRVCTREEGEVSGEESNAEEDDMDDPELGQYRKKIRKLRSMFGLSEPSLPKTGSLSVESTRRVKYLLPHKSDYMEMFEEYMDQVKGAKHGKKMIPMEQDHIPAKFSPKMGNYEVEECPWNNEELKVDPNLHNNEALWPNNENPQLRVRSKHLRHWETSNRESMSVASYTESFLWAGQEKLREIIGKLDNRRYTKDQTMSWAHIENCIGDVAETLDFLQSAAIGLKDIVKMTVDRIGSQVLVRRDTWLGAFPKTLPRAERLELRQASLNGEFLFGNELVEKANEVVSNQVRDQVNNRFLKVAMPSAGGQQNAGPKKTENREEKGGSNFRGKKNGKSHKNDKLWARETDTPRVEYRQNFNRGRGNRGGGGGNRGRGARGRGYSGSF